MSVVLVGLHLGSAAVESLSIQCYIHYTNYHRQHSGPVRDLLELTTRSFSQIVLYTGTVASWLWYYHRL